MTTRGAAPASAGQDDRRPAGRPRVPVPRMLDAALRIADERGADALTMRALAQELGSGTATLYRHFGGRAELVAQVVDHLFVTVELDLDTLRAMGWARAYATVAHAMYATLVRHRSLAPLLVERAPTGPHATRLRETCPTVLLENGFAPPLAVRCYATMAHYVLGFAVQHRDAPDREHPEPHEPLDASRFPATAAVADSTPVALDDEFAFGLDLLVDGLVTLRERGGSAEPGAEGPGPAPHAHALT